MPALLALALAALGCERLEPGRVGAPSYSVHGWEVVSEERVDRTWFQYALRGACWNGGGRSAGAAAIVISRSPHTVVTEDQLRCGPLERGSQAPSLDTITVRHDRTQPFDRHALQAVILVWGPETLARETRVDRTRFDYEYWTYLVNRTDELQDVIATVVSRSQDTEIIDDTVTGRVPATARLASTDHFAIRQARDRPYDPNALEWRLRLGSLQASADANGDGLVDAADRALVEGCFGADPRRSCPCAPADLDGDGAIGAADLALVEAQLGRSGLPVRPGDGTPPVVAVTAPAPGSEPGPPPVAVEGTVDEALFQLLVNGVETAVGPGPPPLAWSTQVPLPAGAPAIVVRAVDLACNESVTRVALAAGEDRLAPVVRLVAPAQVAAGAALRAVADAQDDVGVVAVELFVDGAPLGERAAAPFAFDVVAPATPGAALALRAVVRDAAGNTGEASAMVQVVAEDAPDAPPSVGALRLPPSVTPGATFRAGADASDDRGVAEVRFRVPGGATATALLPPWEVELLAPADAPIGSQLVVEAEAVDGAGQTAQASGTVAVAAAPDTTPPTVALRAPEEAAPGAEVLLAATAQDDGGIASVRFRADGIEVAQRAAPPYDARVPLPAGRAPGEIVVWTAVAVDFAGNAAESDPAVTLVVAPGAGFAAGEVYDDATSRPLAGARVRAVEVAGAPAPDPAPETTSDDRGAFRLPLPEGPALLAITIDGYTRAWRRVEVPGRGVATPLDARLSPRSAPRALVRAEGGVVETPDGAARLVVPPGALAADGAIALTRTGPQALPLPLPPGWTPLAAFEVAAPAGLAAPVSLALVDAALAAAPVAVRFDAQAAEWRAIALDAEGGGAPRLAMPAPGVVVLARPDVLPAAPPLAAPGEILRGVDPAAIPAEASATLLPSPRIVFAAPDARAEVTARLAAPAPLPSGTSVEVRFRETYDQTDGGRFEPPPSGQDFLLFQEPAGPAAHFVATPVPGLDPVLLAEGVIELTARVRPGAAAQLLGPAGGRLETPEGVAIEIAPGALAGGTPIAAEVLPPGALGLPPDERYVALGGVDLDLGGASLASAAVLRFPLPAPPAADEQILLVRSIPVLGRAELELVGMATPAGDTVLIGAGGAGLPLPGVRASGRYALVRMRVPVGFVSGEVTRAGSAVSDALVRVDTLPFVGRTRAGEARYAVAGTLGAAALTGLDLASGDAGSATAALDAPGAVATADLELAAFRPSVVESAPGDGAVGVAAGTPVTLRFDRAMDRASLAPAFSLTGPAGPVAGALALAASGFTATFRPAQPLAGETRHVVRLAATAVDRFGNPLLGNQPDGAFESAFTTADTTPPPRPEAGQISFAPVGEERVRAAATQGATEPGAIVSLVNLATGETVSVLAGADGSFALEIAAGFLDAVELRLRDAAGNETIERLGRVPPPPGIGVVGREGGVVVGEGGLALTLPPAVLPDDAVLRLERLDPGDFPPLPFPEEDGVVVSDAARLSLGGVEIPDVRELRFEVVGRPAFTIVDTIPLFELVDQALTIPADLPANTVLRLRVTGRDANGHEEALETELPIVAADPDRTLRRLRTETSPVVSLELPAEATPGETIRFTAKAEPPDVKVRFALPEGAGPDAQFFVWEYRQIAGREIYALVDSADRRTLEDGTIVVETNSPPYRGIRSDLDQLVLSMAQEANVSLVQTLIRSTATAGSGLLGVGTALASPATGLLSVGAAMLESFARGRLQEIGLYEFNVIPVRAGSPSQIRVVDPATNVLVAQAQAEALAPRAFSQVIVLGEDDNDPLVTGVTSPKNDAVPTDAAFSFSFSHPLDPASFNQQTVDLRCGDEDGRAIPVSFAFQTVGVSTQGGVREGATIVKVTPLERLPAGVQCVLRFSDRVTRVGGRRLAEAVLFPFRTAGSASVVATLPVPGATAFHIADDLLAVAVRGTRNGVQRVLLSDPTAPRLAGFRPFDRTADGDVRDVRLIPDFPLAGSGRVPLVAVSVGGLSVFSSVRLFLGDTPDMPRVGGALVGTPQSELVGLSQIGVVPSIGGDPSSFEVRPADGFVPGVPAVATIPGALHYEGGNTLYFANGGIGVMTMDLARSAPPPPVSERGSQLGPSFIPEDKAGVVVVRTDPDFVQESPFLALTQPPFDPLTIPAGPFEVRGAVLDPRVRRVVVNTVSAAIQTDGAGNRSFAVTLRPRPGVTELVVSAFGEDGEPLGPALQSRLVLPGFGNPLAGPGTVEVSVAGGDDFVVLPDADSVTVTVRVPDAAQRRRLDALFVNGVAAGAKVCAPGVNRRNSACGWSGVGQAQVPLEGAVTAVVATGIDIDEDLPEGRTYSDVDRAEGVLVATAAGAGRLDVFDASGLVLLSEVRDLGAAMRVRIARGVFVDLDGDGRTGDAENADDDPVTSFDELRTLALVGEGGSRELTLVDITEPAQARVLAMIPLGRPVWRSWPIPADGAAWVAATSHLVKVDLTRAPFVGLLDEDGDGRDDRILEELPIPGGGAQDVLGAAGGDVLYVLQQDVGVSVVSAPCATNVGVDATRRQTPRVRPFNSVANLRSDLAFAIDRGLADPACNGFRINDNLAIFSQGSSACIWREDERCPSAFQRGIADYDFEFVVRDELDPNVAIPCTEAVGRSIRNVDAAGIPRDEPLPNGSRFDDVSVFPVSEAELADGFRASQPNPSGGCGAGDDEIGDACLGRNGLMLKWFLEGEWVRGRFGGRELVADNGIDFEDLLDQLARPITAETGVLRSGSERVEPSHIPVHEGAEWACLQALSLERSGVRYRVRGAGLGEAPVQWPTWTRDLHKAGKAGIRAMYGRLLANPVTNRRLVSVSRAAYESHFGCFTDFDFSGLSSGPDETLTQLAEFGWKRCETFEEYVASQALLAARDGVGGITKQDAIRAFEMYRVKSDVGPPITGELAANEFLVKALDLIHRVRAHAEVRASHETRAEYEDADVRTVSFNVCGRGVEEAAAAPFRMPWRLFNAGWAGVRGLEVRAYQDGVERGRRSFSLGAGESRFLPKGLVSFPRSRPFHEVVFVVDPENRVQEYDKEDNRDGVVFYYLDPPLPAADPLAVAQPPGGAPLRPGLPAEVALDLPASTQCLSDAGGKTSAPAADLVMTAAATPVTTPVPIGDEELSAEAGATIRLSWTIQNLGNVSLADGRIRTSLDSGSGCATVAVPGVAVGDSVTASCDIELPALPTLVLASYSADDGAANLAALTSASVELQPIQRSLPVLEPVIFIPGMAGSTLAVDGEEVWTKASGSEIRRLLSLDPTERQFPVEAIDALREVTVGLGVTTVRVPVYKPLLDELTGAATQVIGNVPSGGPVRRYTEYPHTDPSNRRASGCLRVLASLPDEEKPTLFVFPWDWRQSIEAATPLLDEYVECVRAIHGPTRPIHFLAHSMGGLVARRYLLEHPGKVARTITIGSPFLGAPKAIHTSLTGDFIGSPLRQRIALTSTRNLVELSAFFPGAHELLPTRGYFSFVETLQGDVDAGELPDTPLETGRLLPPTPTEPADHERFRIVFDGIFFNASKPVERNMRTHDPGVPEMGDWRRDGTRTRFHHVYAAGEPTITQLVIRNNVLQRGLATALGERLVEEGVGVAADVVASAAGLPPFASVLVGETLDYLLPKQETRAKLSVYGDGTVPAHSALRIRPVAQNGGGPLDLNALAAELKRVGSGEKLHNEMVGNPELLRYLFSILQPDVVQVPQGERALVCPASAPTPQCLPETVQ